MMSVPTIILSVLLSTKLCLAQQPDEDAPVPENFPKAFITAMAVAIICTVIVVTLVCVLAHVSLSSSTRRKLDPELEIQDRSKR